MATRKKILIIDDDVLILELYAARFKESGFDVLTLTGIKEGFVNEAEVFMPDIILLDVILCPKPEPGCIDGFRACELIKADEMLKHVPIIFISNQADAKGKARAFELGAKKYIIKSDLTPSEVESIVTEELSAASV